jgi:hypothetical protein
MSSTITGRTAERNLRTSWWNGHEDLPRIVAWIRGTQSTHDRLTFGEDD